MPEFEALQKHTLERPLTLPAKADELCRNLRNALREAADRGQLLHSPMDIYRLVKRIGPPPNVRDDLRALKMDVGAHCIVGGEKNQGRDRDVAHIRRDDGAWFDFTITVRERRGGLELLAYDFEIRLPPMMGASFLRFDYNLPGHQNESRELRCHLHPGCDDVLLPAPLLTPSEMLAFFVEGLRMPSARLGRQLTPFEVDWLKQSHQLARPPVGPGLSLLCRRRRTRQRLARSGTPLPTSPSEGGNPPQPPGAPADQQGGADP